MASSIMANFTAPEIIGTTPQSLLWLLPIVVAIAVVYKAIKLPTITPADFLKEVLILSGSITIFMMAIAVSLHILAWLITE